MFIALRQSARLSLRISHSICKPIARIPHRTIFQTTSLRNLAETEPKPQPELKPQVPRVKKDHPPSNTLLVLGLDEGNIESVKEQFKELEHTFNFHPTRHLIAFADFADSITASKALEVIKSSALDISEAAVAPNNKQPGYTVIVKGASDEFNSAKVKRVFKDAGFELQRFRIQKRREPYGLVRFASVDAAVDAQKKLDGLPGLRKVTFGTSDA